MRNGVVHQATNCPLRVEEFRGFSIADPTAPVIFINNADSHSAQIFTIRNSRLLTEAVLESVGASEMLIRDASRLLGVKPANLPKLRAALGGT